MDEIKTNYIGVRKFSFMLSIIIGVILMLYGIFSVIIYKQNSGWIFATAGFIMSILLLEMWQNGQKIKAIIKNGKIIRFEKE